MTTSSNHPTDPPCSFSHRVENDLNSAERIIEYGSSLEQEAAHELPDTKPPASWPAEGRIEFKDVTMRYRPELPPALKNMSLSVGKAEKVGLIVSDGAPCDLVTDVLPHRRSVSVEGLERANQRS